MHVSTHHDSLDSSLLEDQKNYRKLRKILRQIEHLVILPRSLNKDEERKVSKRKFYRDQLEALNFKYKNQYELLTETHEKGADLSEPNSFLNQNESASEERPLVSEDIQIVSNEEDKDVHSEIVQDVQVEEDPKEVEQDLPKKKNKKSKKAKDPVNVDDLAQKFESIALETTEEKKNVQESQSVQVKKPKVPEETASKSQQTEKKTQPIEKPKKIQVKTSFSTNLIENAHEDLIVSIDICTESNLIVTGSRDTTLRIWNLEGVKLHSFGGHSKSITFVKFWPYTCYLKTIENLKNEQNEEIDFPDFEVDDNGEKQTDESRKKPLILSSSLDCTLRLWSVYKGNFILEIYFIWSSLSFNFNL